MKNWKKWLVLLLALATVFALAACNKEEPEETEPTLNKGDANCQHVFTEWVVEKERSCTKKGLKTRKCETCGREEEEVLLAYGHTYYGGECSECGKAAKDCEHPETETVLMSEATCTESGESREVCKICKGVVRYNHISALWHPSTTEVVVKEVTCTEDGEIHYICDLCGEVADYDYIWATWHGDVEYVVVSEPTCTENGLKQEICKVCNQIVDEYTLWSNGHSYEYIDAKYPTCTEYGWYSYRHCTVCDYLYNYEERPATGHSYSFGACVSCGVQDTGFTVYDASGYAYNSMNIAKPTTFVYNADTGFVSTAAGEIAEKNVAYKWTLNVTIAGRYFIWLNEVYSGYYLKMYIYNSLGERVTYDTSVYNNEGLYVDLAEDTYTIELYYGSGFTTYNINVGMAKATVDVSAYTQINDKIEFTRQIIRYTYTPAVSGTYFFYFTEMTDNAELYMAIYNRLNERISYNSYLGNGEGLRLELNAGEQYTIVIENSQGKKTDFQLLIGAQQPSVYIDGYNCINDAMTFSGQVNYYQFTATKIDCRFEVINMISGAEVDIYLYNYLGERVQYTTYCGNGEGFTTSKLVVGQTYTIKVIQRSKLSDYTLCVFSPEADVVATNNSAVLDNIEYNGQINNYAYTANADGTLTITLRVDSYTSYKYLSIYIYDADGNRLSYDDYVYNGDTVTIRNMTAGAIYYVRVTSYGGTMNYAMQFVETP